jgi:hypothetical protein
MRRIGVLMNLRPDDAEGQARLAAFLQGLQEAGWAVGRNVRIDLRWGGGDPESFRKQAAVVRFALRCSHRVRLIRPADKPSGLVTDRATEAWYHPSLHE